VPVRSLKDEEAAEEVLHQALCAKAYCQAHYSCRRQQGSYLQADLRQNEEYGDYKQRCADEVVHDPHKCLGAKLLLSLVFLRRSFYAQDNLANEKPKHKKRHEETGDYKPYSDHRHVEVALDDIPTDFCKHDILLKREKEHQRKTPGSLRAVRF
jgi:hypothetical protein